MQRLQHLRSRARRPARSTRCRCFTSFRLELLRDRLQLRRRRASASRRRRTSRSRISRPSRSPTSAAPRAAATAGSCGARAPCARAPASRGSARAVGDVMISTVSEFLSCARERRDAPVDLRARRSAARPPCAPRTRSRSASRPSGSWMTSPVGVKTKISSWYRSSFRNSRNSSGFFASSCSSSTWRNHGEVAIELVGCSCVALLVAPVRRDAEVRRAVHVARADLDLVQLLARAEHRRVQRLVAVRLRLRDVVLDALLHRRPPVVDHAERVVAVRHRVDEHADREQVVDLLVRPLALLHLLVDRPEVLRPARDLDVARCRRRRARCSSGSRICAIERLALAALRARPASPASCTRRARGT